MSISSPTASPLAKLTPVNNAPANPGPLVTAIPSTSSILILADLIASYLDPHIRSMILGIVIGGLLPLALIPFLEILIKKKNKHHIVTGDHEDIKKDLDSH